MTATESGLSSDLVEGPNGGLGEVESGLSVVGPERLTVDGPRPLFSHKISFVSDPVRVDCV